MEDIKLTSDWLDITNKVISNSGLFIKNGDVELLTSKTNPDIYSKGIIIKNKKFFNVYSSLNTYVRSTTTSSDIRLDESFFNNNADTIEVVMNNFLYVLNFKKNVLNIFKQGTHEEVGTFVDMMNLAKIWTQQFGYSFAQFWNSNLFSFTQGGLFWNCFLVIDSSQSLGYRVHNTYPKVDVLNITDGKLWSNTFEISLERL